MCEYCEWKYYLDMADEMLMDEDYDYAEDTVQGIRDWIKQNEHITENQKRALENINAKPSDNYDEGDYY